MTQNAIAYFTQLEGKRHNVETEKETQRHNRAAELVAVQTLEETKRHNQTLEQLQQSSLAETVRYNQVVAFETGRHNVSAEQLSELATRMNAETQRYAAQMNAAVGFANVAELERAHKVQEEEIARHNRELERQSAMTSFGSYYSNVYGSGAQQKTAEAQLRQAGTAEQRLSMDRVLATVGVEQWKMDYWLRKQDTNARTVKAASDVITAILPW